MIKEIGIFLAGSLIATTSCMLYFTYCSDSLKSTRKESLSGSASSKKDSDEVLEREQLSRIYAFFNEEGMEHVRKAFVVVVGAGGVGSHCALHLLRSGVGKIRIIDFDQVTLSSLNRHATATRADVGTPKVIAMKKAFEKILPSTEIDARVEMFNESNADELLSGSPDFVVDAIDNIETKIALLKYCYDHNMKVISSMGSACKSDPSCVKIADISKTSEDRLAKTVRYKLKKAGISKGIPAIFSTERPDVEIVPLYEETKDNPKEFAALPNFRVRILPVLGPLPAIFGSGLAAYVLKCLGHSKLPEKQKI